MNVLASVSRSRLVWQLPSIRTCPLILPKLQTRSSQEVERRLLKMDPEEYQDPALQAAINASLRDLATSHQNQPSSAGTQRDVVDLTGDSDDDEPRPKAAKSVELIEETNDEQDEDLNRAIALSMQDMNTPSPQPQQSEKLDAGQNGTVHVSQEESSASNSAPNIFGLLGIDRKKQEQERLARVAKRKAEQSIPPPPASRESKIARPNTSLPSDRNLGQPLSTATLGPSSTQSSSPLARQAPAEKEKPANATPSSIPSIQFPKGVVKKTWVFGCPRKGDDIKIEEVFQRSDLELAILSAFQWDMEWLFSKLDTARTRFLLVMQAKEESTVS